MIETDFIKHLNRISLIINKRVNSNYSGERPSIFTGHGMLFKDHRIYTPGDDHRDIDWKVFARTDKLHVKRFEEERNLIVHVIVDSSASMGYKSTGETTKFDYAAMIGIGFAYMALKNNERFVLSTFSDKLEVFNPRKGRKQLTFILDYLKNKKPEGISNFEGSLSNYAKLIKHRSIVIIVSDFLYDPEEIRNVLSRFKNSGIKLVQVLDPMEKDLKLKGEYTLKDSETKDLLKTFVNPFVKKTYEERLDEHKKRVKWIAESLGATFYSLSTDKHIFDSFYDVLRA